MPKLTGNCLCGAVSFEAEGEPVFQANCHCEDCRQITGSPFGTLVFLKTEEIKVTGEVKSFQHAADSGNMLVKEFYPACGSQMFNKSLAREGLMAL